MLIKLRLFAMLRERAGASELEVELPEGARVRDALAAVEDLAAGLPLVMAVNREYADADAPLRAGDELALIPRGRDWEHNRRNADTNAHAHLPAALIGPSLTVPVAGGRLTLGTWPQVVLIDFDDRPRERTVDLPVVG